RPARAQPDPPHAGGRAPRGGAPRAGLRHAAGERGARPGGLRAAHDPAAGPAASRHRSESRPPGGADPRSEERPARRAARHARPARRRAAVALLDHEEAAGSSAATRSPPAARGLRVRVPSCAWAMLLTIARPRPTPAWSARIRLLPRWNGSASVETSCGVSRSPVFSTVSTALPGRARVVTHTVPCCGRLWTIALWTRFVVSCSRSALEPVVGDASPE